MWLQRKWRLSLDPGYQWFFDLQIDIHVQLTLLRMVFLFPPTAHFSSGDFPFFLLGAYLVTGEGDGINFLKNESPNGKELSAVKWRKCTVLCQSRFQIKLNILV